MDFKQWIDDLIEGDSLRTASQKIGLAQSTITRQLSRNTLTAPAVIALCRAYGRKPVDGLVETGHLQPWEIEGVGIDAAIDQATNKQLLDGIMRRSDPESQYLFGLDEDVINPEMDENNNVIDLRADTPDDTTPEQGNPEETPPSVHDDDDDDGTVRPFDWEPGTYAADSSPDEDAGREEEGADPFP